MFILEHFWKCVLIIAIAVASHFAWLRYDADQKQAIIAENFASYFDPIIHTARSKPKHFEEAYLQAIATAKRASEMKEMSKKKGNPVTLLVEIATEINGLSPSYAKAANRNIRDSLKICEEFGIFNDGGSNLDQMDIGKPPIIQKGPYEGEFLVPTPILNPLIAKEGLNQLVNTSLVPKPIRTLNTYALTSKSTQASAAMGKAGVMTSDRIERIKRFYRTSRNKNTAEIKANF